EAFDHLLVGGDEGRVVMRPPCDILVALNGLRDDAGLFGGRESSGGSIGVGGCGGSLARLRRRRRRCGSARSWLVRRGRSSAPACGQQHAADQRKDKYLSLHSTPP